MNKVKINFFLLEKKRKKYIFVNLNNKKTLIIIKFKVPILITTNKTVIANLLTMNNKNQVIINKNISNHNPILHLKIIRKPKTIIFFFL